MFTGIVQEVGRVIAATAGRLTITAGPVLQGIQRGGSIAVNGACLTVTDFNTASFSMDVMPETLKRTNLGQLRPGDRVNLERPLLMHGELGGHLVQGHVDGTGLVAAITAEGGAALVRIEAPPEIVRYTVPKGFIAVDGISLTIVTKAETAFLVSVVDYTRRNTILGERKVGDVVNLEIDIIARYVAQFMEKSEPRITLEFLQEHGFTVN